MRGFTRLGIDFTCASMFKRSERVAFVSTYKASEREGERHDIKMAS